MNRSDYFDFIESKLSHLAYRIEVRGRLNILNLHLHSENFYQHFLNLLFGWNLENLNSKQQNVAGIDLIDTANKIIMQVSATATRQKIESALAKDLSVYRGYSFKFLSISKDVKNLRIKTFSNPYNLLFSPAEDIIDIPDLLRSIGTLDIDRLKKVYDFLRKELKSEPDSKKVESNLTTIISILAKKDWSAVPKNYSKVPYDIEAKISYNQLDAARTLIDDYKIHYHRIDKIYSDFDKQGVNKSLSVLDGIRSEYLALGADVSPDGCFFEVIKKISQKIIASANYTTLPEEELVLCVQILVVDAFIRCKIFKNPAGDVDARS
jgi:hypothetical protein